MTVHYLRVTLVRLQADPSKDDSSCPKEGCASATCDSGMCKCPPAPVCADTFTVACFKCGQNTDCFIDAPTSSAAAIKAVLTADCTGSNNKFFGCSQQKCNGLNFPSVDPVCPVIGSALCVTAGPSGDGQQLSNFQEYKVSIAGAPGCANKVTCVGGKCDTPGAICPCSICTTCP